MVYTKSWQSLVLFIINEYDTDILWHHLIIFIPFIGQKLIFLHNNARSHRQMIWPTWSPDMKPIEYAWDILGKNSTKKSRSRNVLELKISLTGECKNLTQELIIINSNKFSEISWIIFPSLSYLYSHMWDSHLLDTLSFLLHSNVFWYFLKYSFSYFNFIKCSNLLYIIIPLWERLFMEDALSVMSTYQLLAFLIFFWWIFSLTPIIVCTDNSVNFYW